MILVKLILIFAISNVGNGAFIPWAGDSPNPTLETIKKPEETCPDQIVVNYPSINFQTCDLSFWSLPYCRFLLEEIIMKFQRKHGIITSQQSSQLPLLTSKRM